MVKRSDRERAVDRAVDRLVGWVDTSSMYAPLQLGQLSKSRPHAWSIDRSEREKGIYVWIGYRRVQLVGQIK